MSEQEIWIMAFITKLARGEIVEDAANVADRAADAYTERWEDTDGD
jgi:hypothetical protein